jgi:hypothetical protein
MFLQVQMDLLIESIADIKIGAAFSEPQLAAEAHKVLSTPEFEPWRHRKKFQNDGDIEASRFRIQRN